MSTVKISVITPSYNSGRFIEDTLTSVLGQKDPAFELEYIVVDGGSTDDTDEIVARYKNELAVYLSEPDDGPADAISKGFGMATGDIICWLNADDVYHPGALKRVAACFSEFPDTVMCFGHCPIVDEQGNEIRKGITAFKEGFFPVSSRFVFQCINYISQPATFYSRQAVEAVGPLNRSLVAAWDYEFFLRLWKQGPVRRLHSPALSSFRWHPGSISGSSFKVQFKEEYEAAKADAGRFSLQAFAHWFVRWGIVGAYSMMARKRIASPSDGEA